MMSRWLALFMALVLIVNMTACGTSAVMTRTGETQPETTEPETVPEETEPPTEPEPTLPDDFVISYKDMLISPESTVTELYTLMDALAEDGWEVSWQNEGAACTAANNETGAFVAASVSEDGEHFSLEWDTPKIRLDSIVCGRTTLDDAMAVYGDLCTPFRVRMTGMNGYVYETISGHYFYFLERDGIIVSASMVEKADVERILEQFAWREGMESEDVLKRVTLCGVEYQIPFYLSELKDNGWECNVFQSSMVPARAPGGAGELMLYVSLAKGDPMVTGFLQNPGVTGIVEYLGLIPGESTVADMEGRSPFMLDNGESNGERVFFSNAESVQVLLFFRNDVLRNLTVVMR